VLGYHCDQVTPFLKPLRLRDERVKPVLVWFTDRTYHVSAYAIGAHYMACPIVPDTHSGVDVVASITHRVACQKLPIDRVEMHRFRHFARVVIRKYFPKLKYLTTFDTWLAERPYSAKVKKKLLDRWNDCGRNWRIAATRINLKKSNYFIKLEQLNGFKYPRGIYAPSAELKCIMGPLVHSLEDVLFGLPQFVKRIPVSERPTYIRNMLRGERYYASDFESFESLIYGELQRFTECEVIKWCCSDLDPDLVDFCCDVLNNARKVGASGLSNFSVSAEARARMSGDMMTSLGNGLVNLIATSYASWRAGNMDDFSLAPCVVEGDDLLEAIRPNCDVSMIPRVLEKLGMRVKQDVFDDVGMAGFCSQFFDSDEQEPEPVIDCRELLCKFPYKLGGVVRDSEAEKLLLAKCCSLAAEAPGDPICRAIVCGYMKNLKTSDVRVGREDKWWLSQVVEVLPAAFLARWTAPIPDSRRLFYERKFGLTLAMQRALEEELMGLPPSGTVTGLADMLLPELNCVMWQKFSEHGPVQGLLRQAVQDSSRFSQKLQECLLSLRNQLQHKQLHQSLSVQANASETGSIARVEIEALQELLPQRLPLAL